MDTIDTRLAELGITLPAPAADARIDDWPTATPWLLERLQGPA